MPFPPPQLPTGPSLGTKGRPGFGILLVPGGIWGEGQGLTAGHAPRTGQDSCPWNDPADFSSRSALVTKLAEGGEARTCSTLIGRQRSATEEPLLPEARTRAHWSGHLTMAPPAHRILPIGSPRSSGDPCCLDLGQAASCPGTSAP